MATTHTPVKPQMNSTTLVVEDLTTARGGRPLAEHLSFRVAPGEGMLLTGPNGAGKTTLLRTIAGFLKPREGTIRLKPASETREFAEHCHYVGHLNGLRPSLTVKENLAFWQRFYGGVADIDRLDDTLEAFDIDHLDDIPAGYLSAGQKRRLGLARLTIADRPIWLLDEPSVSLDTASQVLLTTAVDQHLKQGGIVLAATHVKLGAAISRELKLGVPAAVAA